MFIEFLFLFSDRMFFDLILSLFWLSISAGVLLPGIWLLIDGQCQLDLLNVILERFYLFGKLKNTKTNRTEIKFISDVPKRYFQHFYLVGLLINIPLFICYSSSILLHCLFFFHMCRRLYECFYVHQWNSKSQMSFVHYFIGLIHYPSVGLTIIVDHFYSDENPKFFQIFFALIIFLNASFIQFRVHLTLANQDRTTIDEKTFYPIPQGYWPFDYFSCPNYIAEMFIYFSFVLLSHHSSSMFSLFIWVIVNQSISSLLTHRWYREHYRSSYPSTRAALIPFVF